MTDNLVGLFHHLAEHLVIAEGADVDRLAVDDGLGGDKGREFEGFVIIDSIVLVIMGHQCGKPIRRVVREVMGEEIGGHAVVAKGIETVDEGSHVHYGILVAFLVLLVDDALFLQDGIGAYHGKEDEKARKIV